MTQKSWPWSTVAALGDGAAELSEGLSREFLAVYFGVQNPAVEGVSKGVGGELAVTGTASPLSVASGSGICYGLYINDAAQNTPAIATPAVGTTGGRVVLQTNWAGTGGASLEARTRIAVIMSADGNPAIPALTQVFGTTWEVSLATFQITTGGAITVTDARTFRKSTMVVSAAEITDLSVTTGDIADDAVTDAKLRNSAGVSVIGRSANSVGSPADIAAGADDRILARTGGVLGFVQATIGMIPDALITLAKLANLAGVSLLGRSANSSGVMAAITAAANDRLLRRTGDTLNFGQLTAGMVPVDVIDDTMVGNRVPQFYRRQGGSATDWSTPGNTNQTPTTVRQQGGVKSLGTISAGGSASAAVTFPTPFSQPPLVFLTTMPASAAPVYAIADDVAITANGFTITAYNTDIASVGVGVSWLAIGPE